MKRKDKIVFMVIFFLSSLCFVMAATAWGATLSGTSGPVPSTLNLTSEGTSDWVHWGVSSATNINRKASVTQQISNFTKIGTSVPARFTDARVSYSWSDGTPTASILGTKSGIYFTGAGNGYQLTVPADTTIRTFKVYLGGAKAKGRFEASLSDNSAAPYVVFVENLTGVIDRVITINYAAAGPASLIVKYILEGTSGNITLQAATLSQSIEGTQEYPQLPPNTEVKVILTKSTDTRVTGHNIYWANNITSEIKKVDIGAADFYILPKGTLTSNTVYKFTATAYGLVNGQLSESVHCDPYYVKITSVVEENITGPKILKIEVRIEAVQ